MTSAASSPTSSPRGLLLLLTVVAAAFVGLFSAEIGVDERFAFGRFIRERSGSGFVAGFEVHVAFGGPIFRFGADGGDFLERLFDDGTGRIVLGIIARFERFRVHFEFAFRSSPPWPRGPFGCA